MARPALCAHGDTAHLAKTILNMPTVPFTFSDDVTCNCNCNCKCSVLKCLYQNDVTSEFKCKFYKHLGSPNLAMIAKFEEIVKIGGCTQLIDRPKDRDCLQNCLPQLNIFCGTKERTTCSVQVGAGLIFSGHVRVDQRSNFFGRGPIFSGHRSWNVWW